MKTKLSNYVFFWIGLLLCFAFFLHYSFGFVMIGFFLIYVIFSIGLKKNKISSVAYFFLFLGCLIAYFIRGFVLIPHPELYLFSRSDSLHNNSTILKALWEILLFFFLTSLGFWIGIRKKELHQQRRINRCAFVPYWPQKYFNQLMIVFYGIVFIKFSVIILLGAGIKGEEITSSWAFLLRLIPDDLIFILVIVYIFRYHSILSFGKKLMLYLLTVLMSLSIAMTGSKIFVILLGFCLFIVFLYEGYKINKAKLFFFSFTGIFIVVASFSLSKVVRTKTPDNITALIGRTAEEMGSSDNIILIDMVTSRFIGLDGYLATEQPRSLFSGEVLNNVFGLKNTFLSIADYIVPLVDFNSIMSTGRAVSVYVQNLPPSVVNSGSVGLFGTFNLMSPGFVWFLSFVFGFLIALGYNKIGTLNDPDVKLIVFYFFTYFLIHCFMSGNFNVLVGSLIIKIVLLYLYIKTAELLYKIKIR